MSVLIVGAGAGGGYIGALLIAAGRDVTFLVHPRTLARLGAQGLRIKHGDDIETIRVNAVTAADLDGTYDVIVLAVRANAVESAIADMRSAVGPDTRIVPIVNGMRHLSLLTDAFGQDRVVGGATRLVASQLPDGTINVVIPGVQMEIARPVAELDVPNIEVTVRDDVIATMWEKFAFITSAAILTCLVGDEVGPIARADGGIALARGVLAEVASIATAEGHPLADAVHTRLDALLTDKSSTFGPSFYRDMAAGRAVEITVLNDLAERARIHRIATPLLDASTVRIDVHNRRLRRD
jgi:2-dehydropantoate 2-reductase